MKKTLSILITLALVLSFSVVAVPAGVVGASTSTIDVTQPVQVTNSGYYERGQSIIYDGSNYWLFYGRSASVTATYGSGNPDTHDYKIYYKKASTVAGLAAATPTLLNDANNHNIYLGEISAATDGGTGYIYVYAAVDKDGAPGGLDCDLYRFRTNDGGTSWSSVSYTSSGAACGVLPDGAAHHAAVNYTGQLWIAWCDGSGWASKYYSGSWSSKKDITTTGSGTGKFYVEGTNLYFVLADGAGLDIFQWNGSTWSSVDSATESGAYDPTIYKVGSNYVCAYAPWVSPKQWIKAKVGTSLSTLLSSPTVTVNITAGGYSTTNTWIDMWPTGFTDNGGNTYLFYTSERNPSDISNEIAGNIWYLKVDWPVNNDHYTYIQNAIDAASSTTIYVAPGTYIENVILPPHSLNIIGAGKGVVTWDGNGGRCIDWHEPPATPVITSCRFEISGFAFQSNIPSGANDGMIKICKVNRYQNIGFGLDFHDNRLITPGDSNYGLWLCRNSGIARNVSTGESAVKIHDNIFETTSGICMSNSDNYDIYDNDFTYDVVGNGFATMKNAAIYIGSGCTSEQLSRGGHHIWGNDFAHVGDGYTGAEATYPRGAISIEFGGEPGGVTLHANTIECNNFNNPNGSGIHYWCGDNVAYPTEVVRHNSFSGNLWGVFVDGAYDDNLLVNAENNWWGDTDSSGPYDPPGETFGGVSEDTEVPPCVVGAKRMFNANGAGDEVYGRVDYCPWLDYSAAATTGAGSASFTCSHGCIQGLTAITTPPDPPVYLPYGVFSFNVSCIDPGEEVTLTIKLPGPVPPHTAWWKYRAGSWYALPIGSDDGDNIITVTLRDGVFPGDTDSIAGQITDPGGPGFDVNPFYCLDTFSTEGGSVTAPGEGMGFYLKGDVVNLAASPEAGYKFVEWTGHVDTIADVHDASTTITIGNTLQWEVLKWYYVTAKFAPEEDPPGEPLVQYVLTVSSAIGGSVTSPGEGPSVYEAGTVVNLVASPDYGYKFVNWTGDGITNSGTATTSITMNDDYTVMANFEFEETSTTGPAEESSGPLACFIATAAYGTSTAEQIDVLREFRDAVLLESAAGSQFVSLYYQLSPPIADFIAGNELLRTVVRELLVDPIVEIVEAAGAVWWN